jgi:hypothetical protein
MNTLGFVAELKHGLDSQSVGPNDANRRSLAALFYRRAPPIANHYSSPCCAVANFLAATALNGGIPVKFSDEDADKSLSFCVECFRRLYATVKNPVERKATPPVPTLIWLHDIKIFVEHPFDYGPNLAVSVFNQVLEHEVALSKQAQAYLHDALQYMPPLLRIIAQYAYPRYELFQTKRLLDPQAVIPPPKRGKKRKGEETADAKPSKRGRRSAASDDE